MGEERILMATKTKIGMMTGIAAMITAGISLFLLARNLGAQEAIREETLKAFDTKITVVETATQKAVKELEEKQNIKFEFIIDAIKTLTRKVERWRNE